MGVSAYQSAIASITFQMEEDDLAFTFQPNFLDGYEMIDGLGGTFSKIGSARYTPPREFPFLLLLTRSHARNRFFLPFPKHPVL